MITRHPRLSSLLALCLALAAPWALAHHVPGHHDGQPAAAAGAAATQAAASIRVDDCWVRPLPNKLPSAAYFRAVNTGTQALELIGAEAPGFGRVMLHSTETRDGMTAMVHVHALPIAAGATAAFAPGGLHVMLEKPEQTPVPGDTVELTLLFKGSQSVTTACAVKPSNTLH